MSLTVHCHQSARCQQTTARPHWPFHKEEEVGLSSHNNNDNNNRGNAVVAAWPAATIETRRQKGDVLWRQTLYSCSSSPAPPPADDIEANSFPIETEGGGGDGGGLFSSRGALVDKQQREHERAVVMSC